MQDVVDSDKKEITKEYVFGLASAYIYLISHCALQVQSQVPADCPTGAGGQLYLSPPSWADQHRAVARHRIQAILYTLQLPEEGIGSGAGNPSARWCLPPHTQDTHGEIEGRLLLELEDYVAHS
jgi:hypothetical protein